MQIQDRKNILQKLDKILEELDQVAAGPELDKEKELENVATDDSAASADNLGKDNKDVYTDADHEQVEEVEGVEVTESEQTAAGPELEGAKELKNEATEEGEPSEDDLEKDNKDVYSDEEHDQEEELEPVEVTESEQTAAGPELDGAKELKNEATEESEPSDDDLEKDNKDVYPDEEHDQEEELEPVEVTESKVNEDNLTEPAPDATEAKEKVDGDGKDAPADAPEAGDKKTEDELEDILDSDPTDEDKKEDSEDDEKEEDDDSELSESMKRIFKLLEEINQNAAGPELDGAKELKNEATEGEPSEGDLEKDNKDVYCDDCHDQTEELEPVEIKEEKDGAHVGDQAEKSYDVDADIESKEMNGSDKFEDYDDIKGEGAEAALTGKVKAEDIQEESQTANGPDGKAGELKDEATEKDGKPSEDDLSKDNKDVYCDDCHDQTEETKGVEVTESEQTAAGPELEGAKELKNEATEGEPSTGDLEKDNKDVYCDDCHDQTEEVEGVEIKESVSYRSLKEACMLDEGYFETSSYKLETSDEKKAKLTEQISLLMAREANDPLYEELFRQARYCQKLLESCKSKYAGQAKKKVSMITEANSTSEDKTK